MSCCFLSYLFSFAGGIICIKTFNTTSSDLTTETCMIAYKLLVNIRHETLPNSCSRISMILLQKDQTHFKEFSMPLLYNKTVVPHVFSTLLPSGSTVQTNCTRCFHTVPGLLTKVQILIHQSIFHTQSSVEL